MSAYSNAIKDYVERYQQETGHQGLIDPHEVAAWAYRGLAGIDAFFTHKQRNVLLLMEISGFLALFGHPGARRFWRS